MDRYRCILLCFLLLIAAQARADDGIGICTGITDADTRLACYDKAAGYQPAETGEKAAESILSAKLPAAPPAPVDAIPDGRATSYLERMWELTDASKNGTFRFSPYQPNYFIPWRRSSRPNMQPFSPTHPNAATAHLQPTEVRFQLSFKTKLWQDVIGSPIDLWFAYTQQSNWQLYNRARSSPIRETDYAPELILSMPMDIRVLGMHWKMLNAGFMHQSNGRSGVYSRSWNRVYLQAGLERDNFLLTLRPWYRLPEAVNKNDNPDIRQFMGSGDIRASWIGEEHALTVLGRYSFQGRKGALKFNWVFPIKGRLKGYAEYFNGYGESLIDYNHHQQILGLGLLISTWP
ncbi:MAG: phospholipase [Zetaproteobacteria bacterium CG_4_9_14_3_um_filter_54_145]|nr:MAG: phospholipase [Zetaproteobacteria bacterium CG23_combo_of_CG06-09_8_20_14_all_54_7]PIX54411.1 MAG: phospholipase [Zetaproteobacteria bacterium CG_4_10_14_3_um_filter_54_28]PJA28810.1 MAG: phospholipase [Zetaproteobacteria bacterium CG_4_9_14_3_um_filter_54_145]